MSTTAVLEQKKPDVLEKEKIRKEAIQQAKYQKEFFIEQNKILRLQNERTKLIIEEQELSARSYKAWWEKMHYSIECEKLEPEYKLYQERVKARIEEERAQKAINTPDTIPPSGEIDINTLNAIETEIE